MEERLVFSMNGKELRRFRMIQDLKSGGMSQMEVAEELGLSTRQVRRLVDRFEKKNVQGLIHGLRGKPSNRLMKLSVQQQIQDLWNSTYRGNGFNITHFHEKLVEVHKLEVGRETVRRFLRSKSLYDRKPKRSRKHRSRRERKLRFGEMLQQDTSPHDWLGTGVKYQCVVVVDDATSKILFCRLFEHDGTLANLTAMLEVFRKFGLPLAVYTDKAMWFHPDQKRRLVQTFKALHDNEIKEYESQIGRALKRLGVEFIAAHSAQAKGRVERSNGTLQDRLIAELKLRNITDIDLANTYIDQVFIADYNKRFGVEAAAKETAFIQLADPSVLDEILCIEFESIVQNDNTASRAKYYRLQLLPAPHRPNWAKAKVIVRILPNQGVVVKHKQTRENIPFKILELKIPKEFKYKNPDLADISTG